MRQNEGFPDALSVYFLGGVTVKVFLKVAAGLFIGLCFYLFWSTSHTDLEEFIDEKAAEVNFNGTILVADGDEILFQKAYGLANKEQNIKNTIDTVFPIGSLTKSFTAISILQLEEEGKLSVEQPLSKYVQGFPTGMILRFTISLLIVQEYQSC